MKKFFDIIPPEKISEQKKESIGSKSEQSDFLISRKKAALLICVFVLIAGITAGTTIKSKAKIEILPKIQKQTFEVKVEISSSATKTDVSKKIIPGEIITAETSISQEFLSTGIITKKEKAKGVIRVYNNYSSHQTLIPKTRFLSSKGNLFYSTKRVYIPSGRYLDIEVIAAETGEKYNIKPSAFSIPGLAGSPRYTVVYGKSLSAMKGGEIAEKKVVTQDDLESAEKILQEKALQKLKKSFAEKLTEEMIVLSGSENQEIIDASCLAQSGQELDLFVSQIKAKISAFIFYKSFFAEFVEKYIESQIQSSKKFRKETINYDYSVEQLNLERGSAKLKIIITADTYSEIDKSQLKKVIKGKSLKEAEYVLDGYSEIDEAKIIISPFYKKKCPEDSEQIEIVDKFER